MKPICPLILVFAAAFSAAAQQIDNQEKTLACNDNNWNSNKEHHCEMKEFPRSAPGRLNVDGKVNGGVTIKGWNRSDALIRARVDTWANSVEEARSMAGQIHLQTAGETITSDAPSFTGKSGWSVSWEIFVPHRTDLQLKAHNGGIRISDISGTLNFDALNGGVSLVRLSGAVRGKTTNGGLKIELMGDRWQGEELNVSATNGGVSMEVPANYSAKLETATVNGRIRIDFPVTVQGRIDRELSLNLGSGGPLVRAVTTNGGVHIQRKS